MGVGRRNNDGGTYLSIAAGAIWQKSNVDPDNEAYCEEKWTNTEGEEKVRKGYKFSYLEGLITKVWLFEGEYGEQINVKVEDEGDAFILSTKIDGSYGNDLMKVVMTADFNIPVEIIPYEFTGQDQKKAIGIYIKQGGNKVKLVPNKDEPWNMPHRTKEQAEKMKRKSQWKTFFAEVTEYLRDEVDTRVCALYLNQDNKGDDVDQQTDTTASESEPETENYPTPLKMKKFIKKYIAEEYDDKTLPKDLTSDQIINWYVLAQSSEDLPFPEGDKNSEEDQGPQTDDTETPEEKKRKIKELVDKRRAAK